MASSVVRRTLLKSFLALAYYLLQCSSEKHQNMVTHIAHKPLSGI